MSTPAPSALSRFTMAKPMPALRLTPVTTAVRPERLLSVFTDPGFQTEPLVRNPGPVLYDSRA